MQTIGPTGFDGVTALAHLNDGRLLASARQGSSSSILIEINPDTGQGTLIGILGDNNNPGECRRFPGLTYDSATDTLYGIGISCNGIGRSLFMIDPNTAQPTIIGALVLAGGGNSLAIRQDGTLFASATVGSQVSIYTVNRNTGLADLVGVMETNGITNGGVAVNGLAFHPFTQELFASSTGSQVDNTESFLLTIGESVPDFNVIGQTLDCFDGLEFVISPSNVPAS
jgi:hypothetical protein